MKYFILSMLLLAASLGAMAAPQDARPPLSKDEVLDLLISSAPSKVIVSTVKEYGIAFEPTDKVLQELRRAGADEAVLAALRVAWHADVAKPIGDKQIRILVGTGLSSEAIIRMVLERGIDFQPTSDYLEGLRSQGAKDVVIDTLRAAVPRPYSKNELVQSLTARVDQEWIARKIQQRAIDFEPGNQNLQALRNAGAEAPLLDAVRTARRVKPFVAQTPPPPPVSPPLVGGKPSALICGSSETDVPVFGSANDLGNIVTRLRCGERVIFLEKVVSPPGIDRIKYADGKEGFVSNSYLEVSVATPGGDVAAPKPLYKPDPGYTPEARRDKIEGTVTLSIVVDTLGNVSDVQESSGPLGGGLDKSAIDTVRKWKFKPATRNGVPVAVRVNVEMSFHLYHKAP